MLNKGRQKMFECGSLSNHRPDGLVEDDLMWWTWLDQILGFASDLPTLQHFTVRFAKVAEVDTRPH